MDVNNGIKSMQEELSVLDDVRYGKLCSRCLRSCNDIEHMERLQHGDDDMHSYGGTEDGDDHSLLELNSLNAPTYTSLATIHVSASAERCRRARVFVRPFVCASNVYVCVQNGRAYIFVFGGTQRKGILRNITH